jgi:hypothetical protein
VVVPYNEMRSNNMETAMDFMTSTELGWECSSPVAFSETLFCPSGRIHDVTNVYIGNEFGK